MISLQKRWLTLGMMVLLGVVAQSSYAQTAGSGSNEYWTTFEVPAISSVMRLPDVAPIDGVQSSSLHIVAAKGEYEPTSFIISPKQQLDQVQLKVTDLQGPAGSIPAASVDLKVVKVWYQGGTAWYSYFGDSNRLQLVPELLLNDEKLVKVDTEKKQNFLRVGGEYKWINYPRGTEGPSINFKTDDIADSKTFQPVALEPGQNKQIWVTVKVPKTAKEGVYTGTINMTHQGRALGAMTLNVRVLPFELPSPKTYYNLNNDFMVTLYGTGFYGTLRSDDLPEEEVDRRRLNYYRNLIEHNMVNCRADLPLSYRKGTREEAIKDLQNEVRMLQKAGFVTKPLLTRGWGYWENSDKDNMPLFQKRMDDLSKALKEVLGHDDIYITSWDEAGVSRIKIMRPLLEYAQSIGLKVWLTTREGHHFDLEGYLINYADHGGWPDKKHADTWHAIGSKVASYAGPHTGPENPVVFRRFEGLTRYKAKYDGSFNYMLFSGFGSGRSNAWNDVTGGAFRKFNLIYPTPEQPIDTIAWEGYREGIDDIRYATLLKQEAQAAIDSSNVEAGFVAKKALIWLELLDDKTADLNTARMELIDHILKIRAIMGK